MSIDGLTSGYQSLLNMTTFDDLDIINASSVTVNNNLTLTYVQPFGGI